MDQQELQRLAEAVDQALAAEDDFEGLWAELGNAIEAAPGEPELLRMRIRLARAARHYGACITDLRVLRELAPDDRAARLELAALQHRWAFLLVDDEDEADEDDADEDLSVQLTVRTPQAPDGASPRAVLEQQARDWFAELLNEHCGDAAFSREVFARWNEAGIYAPWQRLTLALRAAAAHPHDVALERELAAAWADLGNQAPEGWEPTEDQPPPMGFVADPGGTLWDPFMAERALAAFERLHHAAPHDPVPLGEMARMTEALCDYPDAARLHEATAQAWQAHAAGLADEDTREQALERAAEARQRAELCRGGRAAIGQALLSQMGDALAGLQDLLAQLPGAEAEAPVEPGEGLQEAAEVFDVLRAQQADAPTGPDADTLAQLETAAVRIAGSVIGSMVLTPLEVRPLTPAQFEADWAAPVAPLQAGLTALGWRFLGWGEWPAYRAVLGHQAVSGFWTDPANGTVAIASSVKGLPLLDLETELPDGHIVATSNSRGRNMLIGGPEVDTLFVEPLLPVAQITALHAARLAHASAGRAPAVRPASPPATLEDIVAMQERGRQAKTRFRLEQGLTRPEALGVPSDFPEVFAPLLQAAVESGIRAMQATPAAR